MSTFEKTLGEAPREVLREVLRKVLGEVPGKALEKALGKAPGLFIEEQYPEKTSQGTNR